ncbi:MAG: glutaredoxin family protein [Candidatus Pacebacteria bacterium]|nr:glutaredoxin family protein [Candidatus Paceibacterota bacterium]MDD5555383.1 glutaredoxin family protein [Candidatus Paceibacterota bacterium]
MPYKDHIKTVPGRKDKDIMMFSLTNCIWCGKTKELLSRLGMEYKYIDIDTLPPEEQKEAYEDMWQYVPGTIFPTVIINKGEMVINGFSEKEIKELL